MNLGDHAADTPAADGFDGWNVRIDELSAKLLQPADLVRAQVRPRLGRQRNESLPVAVAELEEIAPEPAKLGEGQLDNLTAA